MELGTGSSVNSGSKCRRSLGPVWGRKEGKERREGEGISNSVMVVCSKYLAIIGNVLIHGKNVSHVLDLVM